MEINSIDDSIYYIQIGIVFTRVFFIPQIVLGLENRVSM